MNLKPLTIAGLVGSAVWGGFVVWYLIQSDQLCKILSSEPNNFGDFWAGTFAPLAFWWLVLGYLQQGIELRQNVAALEQQSKETANLVFQAQAQSEAIKANELHARRDIFLRYAELLMSDIQSKSIKLISSLNDEKDWGSLTRRMFSAAHNEYQAGDKDAGVRRLIEFIKRDPDGFRNSTMYNKDVGKLAARILDNFQDLFREARAADGGGTSFVRFYEYSLYGDLFAAVSFVCLRDAGFLVRPRAAGLDEILI